MGPVAFERVLEEVLALWASLTYQFLPATLL
jgi:hypothetical protein